MVLFKRYFLWPFFGIRENYSFFTHIWEKATSYSESIKIEPNCFLVLQKSISGEGIFTDINPLGAIVALI